MAEYISRLYLLTPFYNRTEQGWAGIPVPTQSQEYQPPIPFLKSFLRLTSSWTNGMAAPQWHLCCWCCPLRTLVALLLWVWMARKGWRFFQYQVFEKDPISEQWHWPSCSCQVFGRLRFGLVLESMSTSLSDLVEGSKESTLQLLGSFQFVDFFLWWKIEDWACTSWWWALTSFQYSAPCKN